MQKKRTRFGTYVQLLIIGIKPSHITRFTQQVSLNHSKTKEYLAELIACGLMEKYYDLRQTANSDADFRQSPEIYETTTTGKEFVADMERLDSACPGVI